MGSRRASDSIESFVRHMPKAELHLHIEGCLEPELMFELAARNGVRLRHATVDQVRAAYRFTGLQSFLDIYYEATQVLRTSRDFYDLTWSYLTRAKRQSVRHAEIFFDPQSHTARGVPMAAVIEGISGAMADGQSKLGVSSLLIPCFLRHLSPDEAMETLEAALPFRDRIAGFGLDSSESGHPPVKFREVFNRVRALGFRVVAHAGEEGPPEYIWQALEILGARRIDHGVRCLEDPRLVARLRDDQIPLTVCPLSNIRLRVFDRMSDHNLRRLIKAGLLVTVNSDDPAYFGGYINENFLAAAEALDLDRETLLQLSRNAFAASFLEPQRKSALIQELESCG